MFVEEFDRLFDNFTSVKCAAPGKILCSPLSDNSPHIVHWTKASMGIKNGSSLRMVNLPSRNRLHHIVGGLLILGAV